MKRLMLCGFVVLSFFGLMILARGGGGGRSGGGGGRSGGGGVGRSGGGAHFSGGAGRVGGGTRLGGTRLGGTRLSGSTAVSRTTSVPRTSTVSRTTRSGRRGDWHGHDGRGRYGHGERGFRRGWYGSPFWDTYLYPAFYDYCYANPWDERCYDGYDDYVEPGISFGIGF